MHLVQTFRFLPPIFFFWMLIAIVLFVAILEWERLWADLGPRPHTWQVRDILTVINER